MGREKRHEHQNSLTSPDRSIGKKKEEGTYLGRESKVKMGHGGSSEKVMKRTKVSACLTYRNWKSLKDLVLSPFTSLDSKELQRVDVTATPPPEGGRIVIKGQQMEKERACY